MTSCHTVCGEIYILVLVLTYNTYDACLFLFQIDFVAHDDLPYGAGEAEDIYKWLKDRGQWV